MAEKEKLCPLNGNFLPTKKQPLPIEKVFTKEQLKTIRRFQIIFWAFHCPIYNEEQNKTNFSFAKLQKRARAKQKYLSITQ